MIQGFYFCFFPSKNKRVLEEDFGILNWGYNLEQVNPKIMLSVISHIEKKRNRVKFKDLR